VSARIEERDAEGGRSRRGGQVRAAPADPARTPATVLARLSIAPALLLVAWLAVGLPLLLAGKFQIGLALALFVPAAAVVLVVGLRDVPVRAGGSWWSVAGVSGVALAFLVLQVAMRSEQIIVRRDAASYVQFAIWLTDYGYLPIPESLWAFGGADPALSFNSPAFYQRGEVIIPQFMAGLPMILALPGWIGGTGAMLVAAPVLGALAVLAFGGLVARLVGPRWAPVGALVLALALPMHFVSRSSFSEAPALVLLLGGLAMAVDAFDLGREGGRGPGAARLRAALAGLALGLTELIRIDALADLLPVAAFAGLLYVLRRPGAVPLYVGFVVGAGAGVLEGLVLSRPYVNYLGHAFYPLLWVTVGVVAGTALVAGVLRLAWPGRSGRPPARGRLGRGLERGLGRGWLGYALARPGRERSGRGWLADVVAVLAVLVMIGFAVRPYVQIVYKSATDRTAQTIAAFQRINGLPIDPGRQYYEMSLYWVAWYVGVPVVLLATFGAALLVRRLLRGQASRWALPYAVIALAVVKTLWNPAITPDHPWASRRLVPIVIPGLILLAVWTLAWVVRRSRRLGYGRGLSAVVGGCGAIILVVPVVATSGGLMLTRVEQGQLAAVRGMCREIGPGATVLIVERVTGDRFSQVTRGMCQLPVARMHGRSAADVRRVIGRIQAIGRRPVVMAAEPAQVEVYGKPRRALHVKTRQDEHSLVDPPDGTWGLQMNVWVAEPPPA
jgi:hypothetical protein